MRFIRAFWGDIRVDKEKFIREIRHAAKQRLNELVYVWGDENYNILKSFGYECFKVSSKQYEFSNDIANDAPKFFLHKVKAIKMGVEEFGEIIFLDWDCWSIKGIDDKFFENLKKQNKTLQIPLYSFPKEGYLEEVFKRWSNIPDKHRSVTINHYENVKLGYYDFETDMVVPCTCFVYCSDISIINEYLQFWEETHFKYSEECLWYLLLVNKCNTLDEYIQTYEPLICDAKHEWHFNQKELNFYMQKMINKDLYFIHE